MCLSLFLVCFYLIAQSLECIFHLLFMHLFEKQNFTFATFCKNNKIVYLSLSHSYFSFRNIYGRGSFAVHFRGHLRFGDHLRYCTPFHELGHQILRPVFISQNWAIVLESSAHLYVQKSTVSECDL